MKPEKMNLPTILLLIAGSLMFILLAVLEAMAGHVSPRGEDSGAPWTIHIRQMDDALVKHALSTAER